RRNNTRSVVASRPRIRAACTTPSEVVTSTLEDEPTRRSLVRISCARRTHTPDPRRVPDWSRALTATTDGPTAIAIAGALAIGALGGTTSRVRALSGAR